MEYKIEIISDYLHRKYYLFKFIIHKSISPEELQIENKFYTENSLTGRIPDGEHYEIEIESILAKKILEHEYGKKVHLHPSEKTGSQYVCWTGHVPTVSLMIAVARLWCIGTVFTLEHNDYFEKPLQNASISITDFFQGEKFFKEQFVISFLGSNLKINM